MLLEFANMTGKDRKSADRRADIQALEADMAFFDARLSLAGDRQETVYQEAQKKTYRLLGEVLSKDLEALRGKPGADRGSP